MNTTLNISMPVKMKGLVQKRVKAGAYSTPSDYMRTLVRKDLEEFENKRLDTLVAEGIASGPPIEFTDAEWSKLEQDIAKSLKANRKKRITKKYGA